MRAEKAGRRTWLVWRLRSFIGSHLARQLLEAAHDVRALDRVDPQVHPTGERLEYPDGVRRGRPGTPAR